MSKFEPDFTPFKYGLPGSKRYWQIMLTVPLAELQRRHATEMQGKLIGPFDPAMFMKDLMSIKNEDLAAIPKNAKFHLPPEISKDEVREKRLYQLFVSELVSSFIH
jgi:hypothetical protein